ncbi:methionine--tRNA ligase, cytoplasmic [Anopheles arabiensis]|uniref:Methionine--tRNA ligase, cytoplasmic n=1 Tax=Anopheles arabiensis TaxID=7173 RepID=A0A182HVB8_ANOAR|nr:methionine--tRNA ligase, cytoplasmic [Anopheles arabiensis]
MIIYTNTGNPFGLKLLICANLAKTNVEVKHVTLNDPALGDMKHLPILQLNSGVQLFSTDVAAKYLLPGDDASKVVQRDEWLEWSSKRLAPALTHNMAVGSRADPNTKPILNTLVKMLDDCLSNSTFLTGDKISSADVAVWSLLAPDGTLKGAVNIDNVLRWYRQITALPEVQSALAALPLKELSFASLQHSNRFGGLHHIVLNPEIADFEGELLADTSANIAETVQREEIEAARAAFGETDDRAVRDEPRIVLPKPGQKNNLITSALPYVNNVPHLGNIVGCVLSADIFARYSRLCGYNTLYIGGTDEYGTATETKALAENMTPRQICDKYFDIHNSIYRWFGIGFDYFGRTTTAEQTRIVQEIFKELYASGYIETRSVEQLLCQKCDRYLADRFVEGTCPHPGCGYEDARGDQCDGCGKLVNAVELLRPRCKMCNTSPVMRESSQFFLDLPKIEPTLREWVDRSEGGWTHNARVITRAWLKEGLKSRCITRDLKWGIPVPLEGYEKKVFYVWFDAPIGYISITSRYCKEWKQWWQPDTANTGVKVDLYQFMAKDNVPFHSVMFPASLLAVDKGYTLVSHVMATEYLNYEDGKFSKSRGIGVFGNDAQDTGIPADVWRFYLGAARPEGQDSSFSWSDLQARNNSELLKNLGNFFNRALVFCEKFFDSTIPPMTLLEEDYTLLALINRELKGYVNQMEKARMRDGIRHLLQISRYGNQLMQSEEPWVKVKGTDDQKARAGTVIGLCCNFACLLATLIFPFMPTTARNMYSQLNVRGGFINSDKPLIRTLLPTGHRIGKPAVLFTKIEDARIEELKQKYGGVQQDKDKSPVPVKAPQGFTSLKDAQKAVDEQAAKVRKIKSSGADRTVWQPEVNILLELKKQLQTLSQPRTSESAATAAPGEKPAKQAPKQAPKQATGGAAVSTPPATNTTAADPSDVKALEEEIAQQGNKVRKLKEANSDKSVWQPEVSLLLSLKQKLASLTGIPVAAPAGGGKKKGNKK